MRSRYSSYICSVLISEDSMSSVENNDTEHFLIDIVNWGTGTKSHFFGKIFELKNVMDSRGFFLFCGRIKPRLTHQFRGCD